VIDAVVVSGEMTFAVTDVEEFVSNPAVKLALARTIAKRVQCPESWVSVTIAGVASTVRRLRQLQASTVDVLYNITVPAEDSDEALQEAEDRAALLVSDLLYIEEDKKSFKSLVDAELQAVSVVSGISEVIGVSVPEITLHHEQTVVNLCAQRSVLLFLLATMLTCLW